MAEVCAYVAFTNSQDSFYFSWCPKLYVVVIEAGGIGSFSKEKNLIVINVSNHCDSLVEQHLAGIRHVRGYVVADC